MRTQRIKDAYYSILRPLSRALLPAYRVHYRLRRRGIRKVHIGCGPNYLDGFINLEGNLLARSDYLVDVTAGLPFPDQSIDFVYSCHVLEHLYIDDAIRLLGECRRVLRPGHYMRLTLPDFEFAINDVLKGGTESSFPRPFSSLSGQAINFLFCDGQHKYAYTFELVAEVARGIGFTRVERGSLTSDPNLQSIHEPGGSFVANLFA